MRFLNCIAPIKYTATCLRKIHGTSPMANSNFATSGNPLWRTATSQRAATPMANSNFAKSGNTMANGNFATSSNPYGVR